MTFIVFYLAALIVPTTGFCLFTVEFLPTLAGLKRVTYWDGSTDWANYGSVVMLLGTMASSLLGLVFGLYLCNCIRALYFRVTGDLPVIEHEE